MLALPHTNSWGFVYTNVAVGIVANTGLSVTPGASSVEGSFVQIASGANIASEVQYVHLMVMQGNTSAQSKQHFLDFGWDPAGGTSYTAFFNDLACGGSNTLANGPAQSYHFPCKIPAGSTVAVRVQGSNGTAGTVRIVAFFFGKPSRPELWRPAAYSETLGAGASTLGTSFTPGNAGFGSWASLGSPTKKHFWAQLGVQIDNGTVAAGEGTRCQLGIGDGTNMHVITDLHVITTAAESLGHTMPQAPGLWEIPSGSTLYVRGACFGAPTSGYNATAVLFGG